ncbi:MAG: DNA cytosine methyltransferase [Sulfuricurvum sp.]|uniref:DNA cytosine methyltransferase n=1 Tax=Sulfuricurvum sp. TaxID=2025608 RepID=UPI00261B2556|nr:DNA cytosine methyltransferase [Sulfuricurvum sp.]MDD5159654.1 DNA cytosine methyltransferase [Sulfuricurvum sp.]
MNELALFADAGGGILGGKLLGWRTVCAVERDSYAAQVLAQRQNDGSFEPFPIWSDVSSFDGYPWRGIVDVISGGFPCQDISSAGSGCGLDGARSGLWREMARIIGEVRPPRVLVENSPLLTSRGGDRVIGDLTALGYDCKWGVIGAHNADAPHKRDRIWIVATRQCTEHPRHKAIRKSIRRNRIKRGSITPRVFLYSKSERRREAGKSVGGQTQRDSGAGDELLSNSNGFGRFQMEQYDSPGESGKGSTYSTLQFHNYYGGESGRWPIEPKLGRVAHGVANRPHRIKAIGNGQVGRMVPLAWSILSK